MLKKKSQSAIEFMTLIGAVMLFFIIFLGAIQLQNTDKINEQRNERLKEIALAVQDEIALASTASNGYQRTFTLPNDILNIPYNITIKTYNPADITLTQGPKNGSIFTNDPLVGSVLYQWTNPSNAQTSDNAYAIVEDVDDVTYYLKANSFGFNIPLIAIIQGIKVDIEKSAEESDKIIDNSVKIVKNDLISGDEKESGATWASVDSYTTYGSSTYLWGLTWNPVDVNANDFGVVISAERTGSGNPNDDAFIDHIRISITYSVPAPPTNNTQSTTIYAYSLNGKHALALPAANVQGDIGIGSNTIRKINNTVYLNT